MKRTIPTLAFTLCLTGLALDPGAPAQAAAHTTVATADSFSNAADKRRSYGARRAIVVDNRRGHYKRGYLKFRVPAIAGDHRVDTVRLLLHPLTSSVHDVNVVRTGNAWREHRLTWHSRPAGDGFLGSSDALRAGVTEVIDLDVSSVRPGRPLTLRLGTSARDRLRFASSEARAAAHRPRLQVTTSPVVSTPQPPAEPPAPEPPTEPATPEPPTDPSTPEPPTQPPTPEPPTDPPTPEPPGSDADFPGLGPFPAKRIGMSAPAYLWEQRIDEVGPSGVTARRIFADLTPTGTDQLNLVRTAIADGMLPVISYKVPDPAVLAAGGYDAWLANLRTQLTRLDADVTATFWHEPYGDMEPATFRAASLRFLEGVDAENVAVGPILNGWLLDRKVSTFASFTDAELLDRWEFVAVDSYQSGTPSNPGPAMPARALPLLERWMDSMGHPRKPLGLGEYNGFTVDAVAGAGETILSTPDVWFAAAWNSTAGNHVPLAGERITAFQRTKSDPRAVR